MEAIIAVNSPVQMPSHRRPPPLYLPSSTIHDTYVSQQLQLLPSHLRHGDGLSPTKTVLKFIPASQRSPPSSPTLSDASSAPSSPNSLSPAKMRFPAPISSRGCNRTAVQNLSLKMHRQDPPKQLLQLNVNTHKQMLQLRKATTSEMCAQGDEVCKYCYQCEVKSAVMRNVNPLPRMGDRGSWRGHVTKDATTAKIICTRLLRKVCSLCGATGQSAHESDYCPNTRQISNGY